MSLFARLPKLDHDRIIAAIHRAELGTSGEIRVFIARHRATHPLIEAQRRFDRLGMKKTRHRNGVLIFVAPRSQNFAVIGDTAVHEKCGDGFWRELAEAMTGYFRNADFTGGVVHGIERAGALLAEHFPRSPDDKNELSDEVAEG